MTVQTIEVTSSDLSATPRRCDVGQISSFPSREACQPPVIAKLDSEILDFDNDKTIPSEFTVMLSMFLDS